MPEFCILQRLSLLVHWQEDQILPGLSNRIQLLQQELDELWLLCLVDLGEAVDNDEGIVALLELDFIFFAEI